MTIPPQSSSDPYDLERFVAAQVPVHERVLNELRAGRKQTHWMWFVFPQCAGLGGSTTSIRYSIRSRDEAAAYLAHPVLGPRLRDAATASMTVTDRSARTIFGSPDDRKLHSCATLFDAIEPAAVLDRVLHHFFDGVRDAAIVAWLEGA